MDLLLRVVELQVAFLTVVASQAARFWEAIVYRFAMKAASALPTPFAALTRGVAGHTAATGA